MISLDGPAVGMPFLIIRTMAFPESTWTKLWSDSFAIARRPLTGLSVPTEEAEQIARGVFRSLLADGRKLTSLPEIVEFLRSNTRKSALVAVAAARLATDAPALWADPEATEPPGLHLHQLQQDLSAGTAWQTTLKNFRQRNWQSVKSLGVPQEEIEDVLSDTLVALFKPRADGVTRPLDTIHVYEELMPLLHTMAKNVGTDYLRAKSAQKRSPGAGALVTGEEVEQVPSPGAAPGEEFSFYTCYQECRDCLSEFQWNLLMRLYVLESANRMQLIEEPAVLKALDVKISASSATKRRRLNEYVEDMISILASRIQLT
jgi:DNA-directed RNA polymerase specialized sigma24 family protein